MLFAGCYSFTGSSIPPDVKTIQIGYFNNRATLVNPALSSDFTEALRTYILSRTSLKEIDDYADVEITGEISSYTVTPVGITSNATAALNKLTVGIKVNYVSNKNPKDNFSRTFSQFQEFSSSLDISDVETELCETITKQIVEDIFNAAFSNW
jgi:hypothetical protein